MADIRISPGAEAVRLSSLDRNADAFRSRPSRLWLWFVAAFVLQGAMWVAWFTIAGKHRVETVPVLRAP